MLSSTSHSCWPFVMLASRGQRKSRAFMRSWMRLGVLVLMGMISLQATLSAAVLLKAVGSPSELNEFFETSEEESSQEERSQEEAASLPVRLHRAARQGVLKVPVTEWSGSTRLVAVAERTSLSPGGDEHSRRNGVGAPLRC